MMNTIKLDSLEKTIETGDLILFSGQWPVSREIESIENCPWSHIGMAIKDKDFDACVLFESTELSNLEDEIHHDRIPGPKVVNLKERIINYGKEVKPYHPPKFGYMRLDCYRSMEMRDKLMTFILDSHGKSNPSVIKMYLEVLEGKLLNKKDKPGHYFCSELIAATYMIMGIMNTNKPPNAYSPKDFSVIKHIPLIDSQLINIVEIEV